LQINLEDLRRHYASLSDEALREIDRSELVEIAQQCYDQELAQREPLEKKADQAARPVTRAAVYAGEEEVVGELDGDNEDAPEWIEEAVAACSFASLPGSKSAQDAENAREVLENAGIPCYLEFRTIDPDLTPPPQAEYRVLVPGAFTLQAASVLDQEIFNPEIEAQWRTHLEALSDQELLELNKETLLCGLVDRVERVTKVYDQEVARRTRKAIDP
jgi:hypothetical protein